VGAEDATQTLSERRAVAFATALTGSLGVNRRVAIVLRGVQR
jgi:hypothetical protein